MSAISLKSPQSLFFSTPRRESGTKKRFLLGKRSRESHVPEMKAGNAPSEIFS